MNNIDRIAALLCLALSFFVCQQSIVFGLGSFHQPGPGLLDFFAGAGIGILALIVLIQSFFKTKIQKDADRHSHKINKLRFTLICASLFAYAILTIWIGFIPSTFLFITFVLRLIESEKWWRTLLAASIITIGTYLVFGIWLTLDLPKGILFI